MKTKTDKLRIKRAWEYRKEARFGVLYVAQLATIKNAIKSYRHCHICKHNEGCEIIKNGFYYFYSIDQMSMAVNFQRYMGQHCKDYECSDS